MQRFVGVLVTGFGAGYLPLVPGTWGSLVAVLLVGLAHLLFPTQEWIVLVVLLGLLTPVAFAFSSSLVDPQIDSDPPQVVIDEILGQIVCFLWVPVSILSLTAGFLLFRLFDIVKPFPARNCEKLSGSTGIVLDDLVAGCYAGLTLRVLMWIGGDWLQVAD